MPCGSRIPVRLDSLLIGLLFAGRVGAVWPPPQSMAMQGGPMALTPNFTVTPSYAVLCKPRQGSPRLARAIKRFEGLVRARAARGGANGILATDGPALRGLVVEVADLSESLGVATDSSYTLRFSEQHTTAHVVAQSIYGAMYGMETFAQLIDADVDGASGSAGPAMLTVSRVNVSDAPDYPWRGLLVDAGRRFAPMPLLKNIVDTMAAVKLNVLHLHASDFCRFGVQSKLYPELTDSLTGINAGYYTQEDIRALIAYAGDRGVRIVPEFEMPGHALGMLPIASPGGLEFCSSCAYGGHCKPSQLWGTAGTARVLKDLLGEMSALFSDEVFHIGADETLVKEGPAERCNATSTAFLEREVVDAVANKFNKTPAGWEQVLFKTGAATNETIVWAYMSGASKVTATGHRTVEANGSALYFTVPAAGGPKGWEMLWYDIGWDVPAEQKKLLLGGEMSMWTDTYCSPRECGAMPPYHTEKGGELYNRSMDLEYGRSLGGMIWPRGFVGAAAFWNWNSSADASSDRFVTNIWTINDALAARGSLVCPSNCSCDQMTACGQPYVAPEQPPLLQSAHP